VRGQFSVEQIDDRERAAGEILVARGHLATRALRRREVAAQRVHRGGSRGLDVVRRRDGWTGKTKSLPRITSYKSGFGS